MNLTFLKLSMLILCIGVFPYFSSAQGISTSELNKNYNTVLFPNKQDVVGHIFAVDKNNKIKNITDIDVDIKSGDIVIGDYTKTNNFTWGMLLNYLGVPGTQFSGDASLKGTNNLVKKIAYKQTKQYTMDILKANTLIQQKRKELQDFAKQNDLRRMKFYLIIEHITAKQVDYGLTKTATAKDSINVKLSTLGTANASLTYSGSKDYQIHYILPNELSVLYTILPLTPPVAQLSGDGFMLTVSDTKKRIVLNPDEIKK